MSEGLRLWWVEMAPHVGPLAVAGIALVCALAIGFVLFANGLFQTDPLYKTR